jgi:ribitol-5-phosphate 2-dehydrogenase (NADP+)
MQGDPVKFISRQYRLVKPFKFEEILRELQPAADYAIVQPTLGSICQADMRYFLGRRRPEALANKLPMALLHEGIGEVVHDPTGSFAVGERVVIVPNIPGYIHSPEKYPTPEHCCRGCSENGPGNNYCENVLFLGSGVDGIGQSLIAHPARCLTSVPDDVPGEIAALSELMSVCASACTRSDIAPRDRVAIMGDGVIAFILALTLEFVVGVCPENITVVGISDEKLSRFEHVRTINLALDAQAISGVKPNKIFECVGGPSSRESIKTAIEIAARGATLALMGVSEEFVPINTRDLLEKGLILVGCSRSPHTEYTRVLHYMRNKNLQDQMLKVVQKIFACDSVDQYSEIFQYLGRQTSWSKVIMQFNWKPNQVEETMAAASTTAKAAI